MLRNAVIELHNKKFSPREIVMELSKDYDLHGQEHCPQCLVRKIIKEGLNYS